MAIKKFLITGLGAASAEESIQAWLGQFGLVVSLKIIHDGNPAVPVALVEMDIDDEQAFHLVSRISNYWHEGYMVNVWHLLH